MFKTNNRSEKDCFINDLADEVEGVYDYAVTDPPNSFLHLNLMGGMKCFKQFDRIKVSGQQEVKKEPVI